MEIKGKTEELLVKQLKTCERNMKELTNSIKRPNLRITGTEEGEEVQTKGIHNIFNKIITENFPNLEKTAHSGTASRTPNRLDQNRTTLPHDISSSKQQAHRLEKEYCKREKTNNIQRETHQNHSRFLNRNIKSKKSME
jgi:hypothetical protein